MSDNSRPIQTIPAGFLGMIDLKNKGQLPDELVGTVQPVTELTGFWLRARREPVAVEAHVWTTSTIAIHVFATVPQNEWWYLHDWLVPTSDSGEGFSGNGYFWFGDSNGRAFFTSPGHTSLFIADGAEQVQGLWLGDKWIPPGTQIGIIADWQGEGTIASSPSPMWITRCRT